MKLTQDNRSTGDTSNNGRTMGQASGNFVGSQETLTGNENGRVNHKTSANTQIRVNLGTDAQIKALDTPNGIS